MATSAGREEMLSSPNMGKRSLEQALALFEAWQEFDYIPADSELLPHREDAVAQLIEAARDIDRACRTRSYSRYLHLEREAIRKIRQALRRLDKLNSAS